MRMAPTRGNGSLAPRPGRRMRWGLLVALTVLHARPLSAQDADAQADQEGWADAPELTLDSTYRTPRPVEQLGGWAYPYPVSEAGKAWSDFEGWSMEVGAAYYEVNGDRGRFRQDRFADDRWTGGLDELFYSSEEFKLRLRAIAEDDFLVDATYVKADAYRLDVEYRKLRKYYDGSNEAWNPGDFLLQNEFADRPDGNIYADRMDANVEWTLLVPDAPQVKVGWHKWRRFGDEVLLWGGLARNDGLPVIQRARSIPVTNRLDGSSDTLFIEVPFTIRDTYNVTIRQEWEKYQDNQLSAAPTYRVLAGVPTFQETLTHDDDLEWREWRTLVGADAFLTENLYGSVAYYHSDLKNISAREVTRPGPAPSGGRSFQFVQTEVNNDRITDVLAAGLVFLNLAKRTDLHTNVRVAYADTDASHRGLETPFFGALQPVQNASATEELRVSEQVRLVSKRWPQTTVTLNAEWEQRYLDLRETRNFAFARKADIDTHNQHYGATVVHRLRRGLRVTTAYSFEDNEDKYREDFDIDPLAYPGILGDKDQEVHEISVRTDWQVLPAWTATLKYAFERDEIAFDRQGTTGQELDAHRVSTTLFGVPLPGLSCTAMLMYENYAIDTPTVLPVGTQWLPGNNAFDYAYEAVVGFLSGHYVVNDTWSANLSFQHTQTNGSDVNSTLDEVWVGADYHLAANKVLHCRYEYYNFGDDIGRGFDDYQGHGFAMSLAFRF